MQDWILDAQLLLAKYEANYGYHQQQYLWEFRPWSSPTSKETEGKTYHPQIQRWERSSPLCWKFIFKREPDTCLNQHNNCRPSEKWPSIVSVMGSWYHLLNKQGLIFYMLPPYMVISFWVCCFSEPPHFLPYRACGAPRPKKGLALNREL